MHIIVRSIPAGARGRIWRTPSAARLLLFRTLRRGRILIISIAIDSIQRGWCIFAFDSFHRMQNSFFFFFFFTSVNHSDDCDRSINIRSQEVHRVAHFFPP